MAVKGQDKATTAKGKPTTTATYDVYYVVIMVDASHPENALKKTTYKGVMYITYHNPIPPGGDPGHMLYYVVKNGIIQAVYSLGPRDSSNAINGVYGLATADCSMKAMCYAFKFNLTKDKALKLINDTNNKREEISDGKLKYNALKNDTCASTALAILRPYLPNLPKGKGPTGTNGIIINAVTPYWLYDDFKKLGTPYKTFPTNRKLYTKIDPKKLLEEKYIIFKAGDKDEVLW